MKNHRTMKLRGKTQLKFKNIPHELGNRPILEPVKSDFTDAKAWILSNPKPKHPQIPFPVTCSLFPCIPRMHADEVAPDQEFADRRIAAGNVTMGIGHFSSSLFPLPSSPIALKRSFTAILIDSVAMPAVIFE